ncbi:MAG: glycosyltransferase family 2 protein [Raoultibacter sp.]
MTNVDSILVSIIIPVYNTEAYLPECLDSLVGQSHRRLEIICINDGSSDASLSILEKYADQDSRFIVKTQDNAGPGVARNAGIDLAQGEYLYFFDCDDYCDSDLIARALEKAVETCADIVILPFFQFNQQVGTALPAKWGVLSDKFPYEVFSWRDNPAWVFRAFQNFPWNKMYRTEFVRSNSLRFQEIYLTEDLMFSAPALILAERMTLVENPLVYHREGLTMNSMSGKHRHPLDFLNAFQELKGFLESRGLFDQLREAYVNWAVDGCIYNLFTLNTSEAFRLVHETLAQKGGLKSLGLLDVPDEMFHEDAFVRFLDDVQRYSWSDLLYSRYITCRDDLGLAQYRAAVEFRINEKQRSSFELLRQSWADESKRTAFELEQTQEALSQMTEKERETARELSESLEFLSVHMNAAEQKVGRAICYVPRLVQRAILKKKRSIKEEE